MISKKKQQDYLRKRWENILHHFEQFSKRTNTHSIHEIRVELKKLRALIFLQEQSGNKISAKEKTLLKKLFRQAGIIREAQVSSQLIRNTGRKSKEFLSQCRKEVEQESKRFVKQMRKHTDDIAKLNIQLWKKLQAVPAKSSRNILGELTNEMQKNLIPKLKPARLHETRKMVKRVVYIRSLLKNTQANKIVPATQQLKSLEDLIGKWHDTVLTKQLVKENSGSKVILDRLSIGEKKQLVGIQTLSKNLFAVK